MDTLKVLNAANQNLALMFPGRATPITLAEIEAVYKRNVLGIQADAKTRKGSSRGYLTGIMYLAPSRLSGINMCPGASAGCIAACLFTAGRGRFYSVTRARIIKTLAYHFDKARFQETVKKSIKSLVNKAKNKRMTPVVRLNGTSDILWEKTDILAAFPGVQFYDYTKIAHRFLKPLPANYHLTFSYSENTTQVMADMVLKNGGNVAVVFRAAPPNAFAGYPVINGDETDLRFLDRRGVVVGLKAKGKAKKDASGFVQDIEIAPRMAA